MTRRHDPKRVRLHDCYTASELAQRFRVHLRTVRKWAAEGLQPIDRRVPHLFQGSAVAAFIRARNKPRVRLGPGEFYCTPCRAARLPERGHVWLEPRSVTMADFRGRCAICQRQLYRRVRLDQISEKIGPNTLTNEDGKTPVGSVRPPLCAPSNVELAAS